MIRSVLYFFAILIFPLTSSAGESVRGIVIFESTPLALMGREEVRTQEDVMEREFANFAQVVQKKIPSAKILTKQRTRFALNSVVVEVPEDQFSRLEFMPGVKMVERDRKVWITVIGEPKAVIASNLAPLLQRSVAHVGAKKLHERGIRGDGMRIAIVDTGIDWTHKDLGEGFGPGFKVEKGYNAIGKTSGAMDDQGHGTHVSGIAAGVNGVAPGAKLWAIKVLNKDGWGLVSWILDGIDRAIDFDNDTNTVDKADVMNLSLGGEGADPYDSMSLALDSAMMYGVVVAVAAGNDGPNLKTIGTPGAARSAITVGASTIDDNRAGFSSAGPVIANSTVKPDIMAPGKDITAPYLNNEYRTWSGTSMATPHVAGAAALVKQLFPDLSPEEIKSLLLLSAKQLDLSTYVQGYGRLQVDQVESLPIIFNPSTFSLGIWHRQGKKGSGFQSQPRITLKNISANAVTFSLQPAASEDWRKGAKFYMEPETITLAPGEKKEIRVDFSAPSSMGNPPANAGAFLLPLSLTVGEWKRDIPACLVQIQS